MKDRFRKYLPVVVDLETGGFDPLSNAVLEIAITLVEEEDDILVVGETFRFHIEPYEGLLVEQESLDFTKIVLDHPLRNAVTEEHALKELFKIINKAKTKYECSRAILVGHNAHFDSSFMNAAVERNNIKRSPFHPFSVLDTVTLGVNSPGATYLNSAEFTECCGLWQYFSLKVTLSIQLRYHIEPEVESTIAWFPVSS
jgi:ribonuclease T